MATVPLTMVDKISEPMSLLISSIMENGQLISFVIPVITGNALLKITCTTVQQKRTHKTLYAKIRWAEKII